jgi:hypothetical protein
MPDGDARELDLRDSTELRGEDQEKPIPFFRSYTKKTFSGVKSERIARYTSKFSGDEMYTHEEFRLTGADGLRIVCARWDGRKPVRGVLQISHGMGKYIWRYCRLIEAYANSRRGIGFEELLAPVLP